MYTKLREHLREIFEYYDQNICDEDVIDLPQFVLPQHLEEETSFKLYRYSPAGYYNIRNIETQTIHLSPVGVLNDIFEGLPANVANIQAQSLRPLDNLAHTTCMTESYDNTLMWSHYADCHKGICVEYDIKRIDDDPYGILEHLFPVVYWEHRRIVRDIDTLISDHELLNEAIAKNEEYDGSDQLSDILPLVLTKGLAWEYEKEWRIVFTLKQMYDKNSKELYGGNLHFPCISGIYLGYRIDPSIRQHILEIVKRLNVELGQKIAVYQAKLADNSYDIMFDQIKLREEIGGSACPNL